MSPEYSTDPHIIFFDTQWQAFKARLRIEQTLTRANIYRYAALMAPTPRQAQAANRLADQAMDELIEETVDDPAR